jgi:hypothetical protein
MFLFCSVGFDHEMLYILTEAGFCCCLQLSVITKETEWKIAAILVSPEGQVR